MLSVSSLPTEDEVDKEAYKGDESVGFNNNDVSSSVWLFFVSSSSARVDSINYVSISSDEASVVVCCEDCSISSRITEKPQKFSSEN